MLMQKRGGRHARLSGRKLCKGHKSWFWREASSRRHTSSAIGSSDGDTTAEELTSRLVTSSGRH